MSKHLVIIISCVMVCAWFLIMSQCQASTNPVVEQADSVLVVTERSDSLIDDSIITSLPSIADLPVLPRHIKLIDYSKLIDLPSQSSLQKKVRSYPKFMGGDEGLNYWLENNVVYPREAYQRNMYGQVHLCVHITDIGTIDSVSIVVDDRCTRYSILDSLALSVVSRMSKCEPAVDFDGNKTDFWYYFGMEFDHPVLKERRKKQWEEEQKNSEILVDFVPYHGAPEFPGGETAMYDWINEDIAKTTGLDGLSGRVTVAFNVDSQGFLTDVELVKGKDPLLDKVAVRIVKGMPRWRPAFKTTAVPSQCILPIIFMEKQ